MQYVDLVQLKNRPCMVFMAPKFSFLNPDDEVVIRDSNGEEIKSIVERVLPISTQSEEYKFILALTGFDEPFRIYKRMHYEEFDFSFLEGGDADDQS